MIGAGTCGVPNWVDLSTSDVEAESLADQIAPVPEPCGHGGPCRLGGHDIEDRTAPLGVENGWAVKHSRGLRDPRLCGSARCILCGRIRFGWHLEGGIGFEVCTAVSVFVPARAGAGTRKKHQEQDHG